MAMATCVVIKYKQRTQQQKHFRISDTDIIIIIFFNVE